MKVFYAQTIMEKILEAWADAESNNKEIEKIELTPEETVALRQCLNMPSFRPANRSGFFGYVLGISIYVVVEKDEF